MASIINVDGHKLIMDKCPMCGTNHAFVEAIYVAAQNRRADFGIYCPNGHQWHYKSETQLNEDGRVRKERDELKLRLEKAVEQISQLSESKGKLAAQLDACKRRCKAKKKPKDSPIKRRRK